MSLILKGIDLPIEGELHLIISKNGIICGAEYPNNIKHAYPLNLEAKAIQIPKNHGRLIDADLLKDTVRDSVPAYTIGVKIPTFGDTQIMSAIDVMPTILDKERE